MEHLRVMAVQKVFEGCIRFFDGLVILKVRLCLKLVDAVPLATGINVSKSHLVEKFSGILS